MYCLLYTCTEGQSGEVSGKTYIDVSLCPALHISQGNWHYMLIINKLMNYLFIQWMSAKFYSINRIGNTPILRKFLSSTIEQYQQQNFQNTLEIKFENFFMERKELSFCFGIISRRNWVKQHLIIKQKFMIVLRRFDKNCYRYRKNDIILFWCHTTFWLVLKSNKSQ